METNDNVQLDAATAAASLQSLQATRADIADRVITPWWYHAVLGLLIGGLVASMSAPWLWVRIGTLVVFFVGIYALKRTYERLTGIWVNGLRPGRTRSAVRAWFAIYLLVYGL